MVAPKQMALFSLSTVEARVHNGPALAASDSLDASLPPFTEHMQQREFAENTIKSFLNDLRLLTEFLGPATPLASCSSERLERFLYYLQHERNAPCSAKSLDRRVTTLKVFFGWLATQSILPTDPSQSLRHERVFSPLPRVVSEAQVEEILDITRSMRDAPEAPDARPHLIMDLLLATGIKKAECMRIALDHIDLSNSDQPTLYIRYDKPRQRFKSRLLALPSGIGETLEKYQRRYKPVERLFECTPRNLEYVLHNISLLAKLGHNLTFETLRWTSAVRDYCSGMDPDRLRRRLGLSKIAWRETFPTIRKLAEGPL